MKTAKLTLLLSAAAVVVASLNMIICAVNRIRMTSALIIFICMIVIFLVSLISLSAKEKEQKKADKNADRAVDAKTEHDGLPVNENIAESGVDMARTDVAANKNTIGNENAANKYTAEKDITAVGDDLRG